MLHESDCCWLGVVLGVVLLVVGPRSARAFSSACSRESEGSSEMRATSEEQVDDANFTWTSVVGGWWGGRVVGW